MTDPAPAASQLRALFRSLVLDPALLFARVLAVEDITRIIAEEAGKTRDRVFTPPVTVAAFLSQGDQRGQEPRGSKGSGADLGILPDGVPNNSS